MTRNRALRVALTVDAVSIHAAEMDWHPMPGASSARFDGGQLLLALDKEGRTGVTSSRIPVTPDARMDLSFAYTSEIFTAGLFHHSPAHRRRTVRLVAGLRWLNEKGTDIDGDRALLGFPPLAREWQFHTNGDSGTTDAGPLSKPPAGYTFVPNLVPNPTFDEGQDNPTGWKIEGDNSNASAVWQQGGAFSGRRWLKVSDRGPYVRSWGRSVP